MQAAVMFSIDYAACFYIYMIATLLPVSRDKAREKYIYIFMATGMCNSYMDFLTWPLIILGVPLTVYLYVERGSVIRQSRRLMGASAAWAAGYVGQKMAAGIDNSEGEYRWRRS